jgi:hypothetical protein
MYESEFGATRALAEAVIRGLRSSGRGRSIDAQVVDSRDGMPDGWRDGLALLVIGVPTHARTLPTPASRQSALEWLGKPGSILHLEPGAEAPGVREWLAASDLTGIRAAVFSTRMDMPKLLSGSAGRALHRMVSKAGAELVEGPQDFLVQRDGRLVDHELDHAFEWGRVLAAAIPVAAAGA